MDEIGELECLCLSDEEEDSDWDDVSAGCNFELQDGLDIEHGYVVV